MVFSVNSLQGAGAAFIMLFKRCKRLSCVEYFYNYCLSMLALLLMVNEVC